MSRSIASVLPWIPRPIVARVASRYVAGARLEDALSTVADLRAHGFDTTIDLLGENTTERSEAESAAEEYLRCIDACAERGFPAHVSVKPTHVGLRIDEGLAAHALERIAERAAAVGGYTRLDMEDSSVTDATLRLYERLRRGTDAVGAVLQACLRRSPGDVDRLQSLRPNLRICKGIYREPADRAFQGRREIREAFLELVRRVVDGGGYPAVATHDAWLLARCRELFAGREIDPGAYEFQMLLGVGEAHRPRILQTGSRLRVYVPYGPDWYDYSLRRLRENPQIAGHVARAVLTAPFRAGAPRRKAPGVLP